MNFKTPQNHYLGLLTGKRGMLNIKEVSKMLNISLSMVDKFIEEGKIAAHALNAGQGKRYMKRIPVESFLQFLLKTDLLPPEFQMEVLLTLIKRRSLEEKKVILDTLSNETRTNGSHYVFCE